MLQVGHKYLQIISEEEFICDFYCISVNLCFQMMMLLHKFLPQVLCKLLAVKVKPIKKKAKLFFATLKLQKTDQKTKRCTVKTK